MEPRDERPRVLREHERAVRALVLGLLFGTALALAARRRREP